MAGQQNNMMTQGANYGQYTPPNAIAEGLSLTSSNIGAQLATNDYGRKQNIWKMLGMSDGGVQADDALSGLFGSISSSLFGRR